MPAGITSARRLVLIGLLVLLPLQFACQTFDSGLKRKIDRIDAKRIDQSRVTFDADAFQVEVRCRDDESKCQEWAARARLQVVEMLRELEAHRTLSPKYPARLRIQVQMTQYWNPLNLLVFPMVYGVPVNRQSADVQVDLEYNGKVYRGEGGAGCFSTWILARGSDGSSGCAVGEGVAEAINTALTAGINATKEAP